MTRQMILALDAERLEAVLADPVASGVTPELADDLGNTLLWLGSELCHARWPTELLPRAEHMWSTLVSRASVAQINLQASLSTSSDDMGSQMSLLTHVCAHAHASMAEAAVAELLRAGADVNATNEQWGCRPALLAAVCKGPAAVVRALLDAGATLCTDPLNGTTLLHAMRPGSARRRLKKCACWWSAALTWRPATTPVRLRCIKPLPAVSGRRAFLTHCWRWVQTALLFLPQPVL
jgi:hypothetical protein